MKGFPPTSFSEELQVTDPEAGAETEPVLVTSRKASKGEGSYALEGPLRDSFLIAWTKGYVATYKGHRAPFDCLECSHSQKKRCAIKYFPFKLGMVHISNPIT